MYIVTFVTQLGSSRQIAKSKSVSKGTMHDKNTIGTAHCDYVDSVKVCISIVCTW